MLEPLWQLVHLQWEEAPDSLVCYNLFAATVCAASWAPSCSS